jgi:hypothetical protein
MSQCHSAHERDGANPLFAVFVPMNSAHVNKPEPFRDDDPRINRFCNSVLGTVLKSA